MKKMNNHIISFFTGIFLVLLISSCGDSGNERRTEEDRGVVDEETFGGRPSEALVTVRGIFRDGRQNCLEGFGLCDVQIHPQMDRNIGIDTLNELGARVHMANFVLDTEDKNSMRIEFAERIPHFQSQFVVDSTQRGFRDIFGADSVFVRPGIYQADNNIGDFGGVSVQIRRVGVEEPIN